MDQIPSSLPAPDPFDPQKLLRILEEGQAKLLLAAQEWGMTGDQPFANFVAALLQTQRRFAETNLAGLTDLHRLIANARLLTEGDILRQKQIAAETARLMVELRQLVTSIVSDAQEERRTLNRSMLDAVLLGIFKALEKPLGYRAIQHRNNTLVGLSGLSLAAGGLLVVFGYGLSVWNDWTGSARLDHLRVAVARCEAGEAGEAVEDANKVRYCLLCSLLPRDYVPVRAAETEARSR